MNKTIIFTFICSALNAASFNVFFSHRSGNNQGVFRANDDFRTKEYNWHIDPDFDPDGVMLNIIFPERFRGWCNAIRFLKPTENTPKIGIHVAPVRTSGIFIVPYAEMIGEENMQQGKNLRNNYFPVLLKTKCYRKLRSFPPEGTRPDFNYSFFYIVQEGKPPVDADTSAGLVWTLEKIDLRVKADITAPSIRMLAFGTKVLLLEEEAARKSAELFRVMTPQEETGYLPKTVITADYNRVSKAAKGRYCRVRDSAIAFSNLDRKLTLEILPDYRMKIIGEKYFKGATYYSVLLEKKTIYLLKTDVEIE